MWRRQLPAWSPVTIGALAAGASASSKDARHAESLDARLRSEYGASVVQLTESGTAALALAMLAAAPEGTRPRVAMPAWGCYDLMTAADIADAEVVLYDLDPATLEPALGSFAAALERRPIAVVVAHWFGLPVSLDALIAAAREAGATFIEDAAQGVGGMIGERQLGSLGDFGILSFGRGKGRTGGRGGALLANNAIAVTQLERVAQRVAVARSGKGGLAALAGQWAVGRPWAYAIPSSIPSLRLGETVYHPSTPIRGMPEWAAAVAGALWRRSALESAARRAAAARWSDVLAHTMSVRAFAERAGSTAGWLRFPVLVNDSGALLDGDARRLGIMPGYEGILADLQLAPGRLMNTGSSPGAAQLASRLRTLPSHSLLRPDDVAAIVQRLEREEQRRP
jgi:perosamine synthetase